MNMTGKALKQLCAATLIFFAGMSGYGDHSKGLSPIILENDAMRIVFSNAEEGFACRKITNKLEKDVCFVKPGGKRPGLWQLEFFPADKNIKNPEQLSILLENTGLSEKTFRIEENPGGKKLVLDWKNLSLPGEKEAVDVLVTVLLDDRAGESSWTIDVKSRSKKWGLTDVRFPVLSQVADKGAADLLLPTGNWGGTLIKNSKRAFDSVYPSVYCQMQFMAFSLGNVGLYIGAHDKTASYKHLAVTSDQDAYIGNYPENSGVPGRGFSSPYPVVIKPYKGDWWKAAKIYRNWAGKQIWTSKGPLIERKDIPDKFKNADLWIVGDESPAEVRVFLQNAEKALGPVTLAYHWYNWHKIPFDNSYPEYFPAKDGVADLAHEMTVRGHIVIPYINGRLWDSEIASFKTAYQATCKDRKEKPYTEIYASGRKLSPMCPATVLWQNTIHDIIYKMLYETGVSGVYLDQIASCPIAPCYDPAHGHPLGGGHHWVDGYRKMLSDAKEMASARNACITTENSAESYMDNIDGFLIWCQREETDVPLLTAVYSGYTVYFGSPQSPADNLQAFVMAQGRDFLWGCHPGWNGRWLFQPEHRQKLDFMKKIIAYRKAAKDFFVNGELLGEIKFSKTPEMIDAIWNFEKTHKVRIPGIMGTIWKSGNGELALCIVNFSDRAQRISFCIDPAVWLPEKGANDNWLWTQVCPNGKSIAALEGNGAYIRNELLEGYDIMLYTIKPSAMTVDGEALLKNKLLSVTDDFRFEIEAKKQGLSLDLSQYEIRIVDSEKGVLLFKIENTSRQPHEISIYISDSFLEKFSVPGNGFIEKKHLFIPVESDLKRGFIEVTAKLESESGVFYGRTRIPLLRLPSLQISVGTPDTPLFKGECFPVNIEVINNSSQPISGELDIKMTGGRWEYAGHALSSENTLSLFEQRKFSLACVVSDEKDAAISVAFAGCRESKNFIVNSCRQEAQAVFATKRPTIDGNLDDWENSFPSIELGATGNRKTVKFSRACGGTEDCSGSIFLSWDHDNLYFAAKIKDNMFSQDATAGEIWQGDCIQIGLRLGEPSKNRGFDERTYVIGLAQTSDGPVIFQWHPEMKFIKTGKFVFKREKNLSIYEAAIPWNAAGIRAGATVPITCSMTINDNDGDGFRGWLEWTPGLCGGNDSSSFGKLKLLPDGN